MVKTHKTRSQEHPKTVVSSSTSDQDSSDIDFRAISRGKQEWEKTVDAIEDIITIQDLDMKIIRANRAAHEVFGFKLGELIGKTCYRAFHKRETPCPQCPTALTIDDSQPHRGQVNAKETGQTLDVSSMPLMDGDGKLSMVVNVARDITDTLALNRERKRLYKAIEQLSEAVVITDNKGVIQYVNQAFTQITGYGVNEATGQNISILKSGELGDDFYRLLWKKLLSGKVWKGTFINRRKNGTLYSEEATISPVVDNTGKISSYIAVKRDMSKEQELENQLQQAIKLEAIGTLAGGIAHDFNNILSTILGYTQVAMGHLEADHPASQALMQVETAGDRAAELVKQILTFSRQDTDAKPHKPMLIQHVLKEALKMIRSSLPATIQLTHNIDPNCPPVVADAIQIHQVIVNLLTNAKQAISEDYGEITVSLFHENSNVCIKVSDTGKGMDEETQQRVFDPFFTTKPLDCGTGLGLSVVHGIINKLGGSIELKSQVEQGSTFMICLPASRVEVEPEAPQEKKRVVGGTERILVVDDEPSLSRVLKITLERIGYTVTEFNDSIEAVSHFRQHSDEYDLVVTDMTMPRMTGAELAREILSLRKDMPIILVTGFSEIIDREKAMKIGIREFFQKPVRKNTLAKTIRTLLDHG